MAARAAEYLREKRHIEAVTLAGTVKAMIDERVPSPGIGREIQKSFFDGANKSYEHGYLTLAGLAMPDALVLDFENRWRSALDSFGLSFWHTTDAMSFAPGSRRSFLKDPQAPWTRDLAEGAKSAMSGVTKAFSQEYWRDGFLMLTCCVNLSEYRSALARNPLLRSAEAICVHNCVGRLGLDDPERIARIHFDKDEDFMKEVEQVYSKDRKKDDIDWPKQVEYVKAVDSHEILPVQAADLLAWQFNLGRKTDTLKGATPPAFGRSHAYYGLVEIEAEYTAQRERARAEAIRRARRRTRETEALTRIERGQAQGMRPL